MINDIIMSASGILWQQDPNREYGYGAGRANLCVKFVACPTCKAPKGKLCIGKNGPKLDRHYERCNAAKKLRNR